MITPCNGCPAFDWCRRRGCIVWNDESRVRYYELERRAKEYNDWIDQFEKGFLSPQGLHMTEHTPTPWKAEEGYAGSGPFDRLTIGNSEVVVGVINRLIPAGPANAAFIVKAVNNHDALVRDLENAHCALKAMKEAVEGAGKMNGREYIDLGIQVNNAIDRAYFTLRAVVSTPQGSGK